MKKIIIIMLLSLAVMSVMGVNAWADEIEGYMVPEYYMVANHYSGEKGIEGDHGFWLRRIYFGYNAELGDDWSARVRFEMNSAAFASSELIPYVKDAFVKKKFGGMAIIAGIIEPPSFNLVEKFWGYRYIEKTAPDYFKLASSRDFGIALDGKTAGGIVYTVMYGNYSSNKGEAEKGKVVYGRLGYEAKTAYVEANAHFGGDAGKDKFYLTLFGGLKGDWGRFGVGYHMFSQEPKTGKKEETGVVSGFAVLNLSKKTEVFARYDHLTDFMLKDLADYLVIPGKHYKPRVIMAGVNFKVSKNVELSPNFRYVFYTGDNKPKGDLYMFLTAKISYKSILLGSK